jgi:hypothetical protein
MVSNRLMKSTLCMLPMPYIFESKTALLMWCPGTGSAPQYFVEPTDVSSVQLARVETQEVPQRHRGARENGETDRENGGDSAIEPQHEYPAVQLVKSDGLSVGLVGRVPLPDAANQPLFLPKAVLR